MRRTTLSILFLVMLSATACRQESAEKPTTPDAAKLVVLPSWADTPRQRIQAWVQSATDTASTHFIPEADRIAVFDNDGTLWPEQPVPNQAVFAIDHLKALAPSRPDFGKDPVLKGIINGDLGPMKQAGMKGLMKLVTASHSGMTAQAFDSAVRNWIDTARDKRFDRPYRELTYKPMVELLEYLRMNGFKTFIVSGGGADFMRVWSDEAYGIPPYQVIGSYGDLKYEAGNGTPVVTKTAGEMYVDDKAGKPVAIRRFIGKVPVFCGGNSDGDQAMMQYTQGSRYKSMNLIVRHTDAAREYAYETKTLSGHLETALAEAKERDWMVVDMARDWKRVFAFEK